MIRNLISFVLGAAVCAALGYFIVLPRIKPVSEPQTIERVITKVDTLRLENPPYLTRYVRDTIYVPVDTVRLRDTLYVQLPREVKEYGDDNYYARVSGYRPELEEIQVYNRVYTRYLIPAEQPKKDKRWGLGIQAGVGVSPGGLQPYLGAGISYNFILF